MKKIISKIVLTIISLSTVLTFQIAYADTSSYTKNDEISGTTFNVGDTLKLDNDNQKQAYYKDKAYPPLISFILQTLDYATAIIGSLALILLIFAGFRFMVAGGVQQKIDEAKDMVKFVLIGLVVTFLSYTLTIFLQSVFIPQ